ncbi:MAG: dephospho-CoA kinase [Zetaproteobacteria bacterium CG_4_9_14_3_um_filter_49_83]|nr:MAG: dephospho-CoA kinase [Zetaproteobacteria bacterium CG1_02_49_23]PIQ30053.1 MAG: dephospho-CoA kinase [Zetaproteobacteria bacterium CG17_big_fil_post_rev_8_21_14_2_50_50_13]PIV29205.1 MAG: dephospho-CoA kinase [Zetaproteobacteria bacterium CG02_land_8_20_14_3_00_50_9]PIY55999.1 MAG: dephospho-CoA kinase [Zetaproteobacteria bacterium CG_4_10_14_0_8_um_filter_49_80]PJA36325.1 MAG: dephospho-CoA kinase [Zetaproteobacteria bacterium CG_4_9_14_3_um_filter_49_83]
MTFRVGLTGGIGSGKSTVASMFETLGIPILDLDTVGRFLLTQEDVINKLVAHFGKSILGSDGLIVREKLAVCAFQSEQQTHRLNGVMHPLIRQNEQQWVDAHENSLYVLIEASVLIESGAAERMDHLIVVLADEALRYQRVLNRGYQDENTLKQILKRQCNDATRMSVADDMIYNQGSLELLRQDVLALHKRLLMHFSVDSNQADR